MAIGNQANATWRNCAPSTPNTLWTPGDPSISPGLSRIPSEINTRSMAVTHANHRHRGDGRCPSGNSRSRKVMAIPNDGQPQPLRKGEDHGPAGKTGVHVDRVGRVPVRGTAQNGDEADLQEDPPDGVARLSRRDHKSDYGERQQGGEEHQVREHPGRPPVAGLHMPGENAEPDGRDPSCDRQAEEEPSEPRRPTGANRHGHGTPRRAPRGPSPGACRSTRHRRTAASTVLAAATISPPAASDCRRCATLTASPITVYSSRPPPPIAPAITMPGVQPDADVERRRRRRRPTPAAFSSASRACIAIAQRTACAA